MNKYSPRAITILAKWAKGNHVDKRTVRKLRTERDLALVKHRAIGRIIQESYPVVKQYLDAVLTTETAERAYSIAWAELKQEQREELIPEFWPSAQLRLPKGEPMPKRRDMSSKEFEAALERRGFRDVGPGIKVSHNVTIGPVLRWNEKRSEYQIDHRETLKRAIESAREENA